MRRILVAVLVAGALALWGGGVAGADPADELIQELRCPGPYSQPLATSDTPEAVWMRAFVRAKLAEGWPKQRIVDTLVRQFGEHILPVPPKQGFSLAAWLTPFATIFGGAAVVGVLLTRWLRERKWHDAYLNAEMAREIDKQDMQRYEAQLLEELRQFE